MTRSLLKAPKWPDRRLDGGLGSNTIVGPDAVSLWTISASIPEMSTASVQHIKNLTGRVAERPRFISNDAKVD